MASSAAGRRRGRGSRSSQGARIQETEATTTTEVSTPRRAKKRARSGSSGRRLRRVITKLRRAVQCDEEWVAERDYENPGEVVYVYSQGVGFYLDALSDSRCKVWVRERARTRGEGVRLKMDDRLVSSPTPPIVELEGHPHIRYLSRLPEGKVRVVRDCKGRFIAYISYGRQQQHWQEQQQQQQQQQHRQEQQQLIKGLKDANAKTTMVRGVSDSFDAYITHAGACATTTPGVPTGHDQATTDNPGSLLP
ncbi:hypothetical protein RI054_35g133730 [Pseudoscourfieldia marina]